MRTPSRGTPALALLLLATGAAAVRAQPPGDADASAVLRDRLLGTLVGSAIGDAMGAPTEMWPREQIQAEYGFVRDLEPLMREPSPEGVWQLNLRAGATTDDTRWKALAVEMSRALGMDLEALADRLLEAIGSRGPAPATGR